jgi:hypothetical protein
MDDQKQHIMQLNQRLQMATKALSWDQQRVLELKRRFARHTLMYRKAYKGILKELRIAEETLFSLAFLQKSSHMQWFFELMQNNTLTVAQCSQVIGFLCGTAQKALQDIRKIRGF